MLVSKPSGWPHFFSASLALSGWPFGLAFWP